MTERNPDGTFAEGNTLGGNTQRGRATWRKRVEQLDLKYDTVQKLLALFVKDEKGELQPGPELLAMHPRDAAILIQSLGAVIGNDRYRERESFLDRDEGKAPQSIRHGGDPDNPSPISMDGVFTLTFGTEDNNDVEQKPCDNHDTQES